jgi:nicotinate-nucleotide adenylyltransferase
MKLGICGGTFDPFHRGHLEPILAVRGELEWDRVEFVPAWMQPFKQDRASASAFHRFAMAVLATASLEGLFVSPRELERGAVSYTVETLEAYRAERPGATIDWIIGEDNVADLLQWKSLERIFELANFVVLARRAPASGAGDRFPPLPDELANRISAPRQRRTHGCIVFADSPIVPVSSTDIRARIRAGEPVDDLVGASVSRYIERNGLYGKGVS